ncbi:MAG: hypothetical protein QJR14_03285 [Bacillota bacterium]|nr:hypothetical protein [Bacillota bacterium]
MEPVLLVVDVDSRRRALRAALAEPAGRAVAFLAAGWPEGRPAELEQALVATLRDLVRRSGLLPQEVGGLVLAADADEAMLWRADGRPLAGPRPLPGAGPQAAAAALEELRGSVPEELFPAERALRFGPLGAWLVAALCGGEGAAEAAGGDRFGLFDRRMRGWLPPARGEAGSGEGEAATVPRDLLPPFRPSLGHLGWTTPRVLDFPLPVVALVDRRVAEVAGHAAVCRREGGWPGPAEALLLLEEEATLRVVSDLEPEELELRARMAGAAAEAVRAGAEGGAGPRLRLRVALQEGLRLYTLAEAEAGPAGLLDRWFEEALGLSASWAETERLARSASAAAGARLESAGGGRWTLRDLDGGTDAAVLARLIVQAPAEPVAGLLAAWRRLAGEGRAPDHLHVGGLAALSDLRLEELARASGLPVLRATHHAAVERGGALLGARALGLRAAGQENDPFPVTRFYPEPGAL